MDGDIEHPGRYRKTRFGVAFRLFVGLTTLAVLAVIGTGTVLVALKEVRQSFDTLATHHLPTISVASRLGQQGESAVAQAPSLALADSQAVRRSMEARIADQVQWLKSLARRLEETGVDPKSLATLNELTETLAGKLVTLGERVGNRLVAEDAERDALARLRDLSIRIGIAEQEAAVEVEAWADVVLRNLERETEEEGRRKLLAQFRDLNGLENDIREWAQHLHEATALLLTAPILALPVEMSDIHRAVTALVGKAGTIVGTLDSAVAGRLIELQAEFAAVALSETGVLAASGDKLALRAAVLGGLSASNRISNRLSAEVAGVFASVENDVLGQGRAINALVDGHTEAAVAAVVLCVLGAVLMVVWSQRSVVRRLVRLRDSMVAVGQGDRARPIAQDGEDEIAHMSQALAGFVAELSRHEEQLIRAKEQAEIGNRAKSQFLANMSHELRTPLNAIIGFSEIMAMQGLGPIGTPKYVEYSGDIRESGLHLLDLINDLLDLSKAEAGKMELREETVEPGPMVTAAVSMVREKMKDKDIIPVVSIGPDLPRIRVDERKIRQILINLLSNAVKFTPEGGTIAVSARRKPNGGLVFIVADTGPGIPADQIPRVLEPFNQLDSDPTVRKETGTGLGLPLAKSLAELHGGTFDLVSVVGKGTTVILSLPPRRSVPLASA